MSPSYRTQITDRLAVDQNLSNSTVLLDQGMSGFAISGSGASTSANLVNTTVPGGVMGTNGYVQIRMFGRVVNSTSATSATVAFATAMNSSVVSAVSITVQASSSSLVGLQIESLVVNQASESSQLLSLLGFSGQSSIPGAFYVSNAPVGVENTAADWTLTFAATQILGSLTLVVHKVLVESVFLP